MNKSGKIAVNSVLAVCAGLLVIQLIPYGHIHSNPPVIREPVWDSPDTRALAKRACFDCHSHETVWSAWYTKLAPSSWLVQYDVDQGRRELNFSDWQGGTREGEGAAKLAKAISGGEMPPIQYRLAHPEARLSETEKKQLIDGLAATASRR